MENKVSCGGFGPFSSSPPLSSPHLPTLSELPSLVTASLLLLVHGYDRASSAFARNLVSLVNLVAVERGTRCWRPISKSFDVLFIPTRFYLRPQRGFLTARESWNSLLDEGAIYVYDDSDRVLWNFWKE